jgi:hypothetical protein
MKKMSIHGNLKNMKEPKQKRARVTVDSILEASKIVIEKSGLEKFNTNYIAEVAGVSIGSLYQYFKNKESILEVLLDKELTKSRSDLDEILKDSNDKSLEEVVNTIVIYLVENWEKKGVFGKIIFQYVPDIIDLNYFKKIDQKLIPYLVEKVSDSNESVNEEDLDYAIFLIIQTVRSTILLINDPYKKMDIDKIKKELSIMISSYLRAR